MKRGLAILLLGMMAIALFGCQGKGEGKAPEDPSPYMAEPAPVKFPDFAFQVCWVNYSDNSDLFSEGIRSEKLSISGVRYLPIFKLSSEKELSRFRAKFEKSLDFDSGYDEAPSFDEISSKFTEEFFAEKDLLLVYATANSGSHRFTVDSIAAKDDEMVVHIMQKNRPEVCTDDMAGWLFAVEVKKSDMQAITKLYADMNNR